MSSIRQQYKLKRDINSSKYPNNLNDNHNKYPKIKQNFRMINNLYSDLNEIKNRPKSNYKLLSNTFNIGIKNAKNDLNSNKKIKYEEINNNINNINIYKQKNQYVSKLPNNPNKGISAKKDYNKTYFNNNNYVNKYWDILSNNNNKIHIITVSKNKGNISTNNNYNYNRKNSNQIQNNNQLSNIYVKREINNNNKNISNNNNNNLTKNYNPSYNNNQQQKNTYDKISINKDINISKSKDNNQNNIIFNPKNNIYTKRIINNSNNNNIINNNNNKDNFHQSYNCNIKNNNQNFNNINVEDNNYSNNKNIKDNKIYIYSKSINNNKSFKNNNFINQNQKENEEEKEKDKLLSKLLIKQQEKIQEKEDENETNLENYLCPKCQEKAFIELNPNSLTINMKCEKGHHMPNIPIKEIKSKNELNKKLECSKCREKNLKPKDFYYCSCSKIMCNKCRYLKIHDKHSQIKLSDKPYYCIHHFTKYKYYCNNCNENICNNCLKEHKTHNIVDLKTILPGYNDIREVKNAYEKIKNNKNDLKKKFDEFIESYDELTNMINNMICKNKNKECLNYEDIINIKNIKKYENNINNINKKLTNYLINLLTGNDIEYKISKNLNSLSILSNKKKVKNEKCNKISFNIINKKKVKNEKCNKISFNIINKKTVNDNNILSDNINKLRNINKIKINDNTICNNDNFNILQSHKIRVNNNIICNNINNFNININNPNDIKNNIILNNENKLDNNKEINSNKNINNDINILDLKKIKKSNYKIEEINNVNSQESQNDSDIIKSNIKEESNKLSENIELKNNVIPEKTKEEEVKKITENIIPEKPKEIKILEKVENCELKLENKDERCITSIAILRNNRILFTFKGGILKFYEFEKNNINNQIKLKELLRLEEEEYCFNYGIELYDGNVAVCSEDATLKIIKLFFDERNQNNEVYKIVQLIQDKENDPMYIVKELSNHNIVIGMWKNILVYQKADEYELINKLIIGTYNFSIIELSPNVIISSQSQKKTLTIHDLNDYNLYQIKNIESNENNNIICKYNNKNEIVFVAYDKGIQIVSVIKKCLIKKIELGEIISGLCPMITHLDMGNGKIETVFGLICGAKRKIYGENVNYAYSLLQLGFNLNNQDKGVIDDKDNKEINYKIISRKDRIHYYDITNIKNSIICKNKNTLKIYENEDEQWIFSIGNEDKNFKIWKINN